MKFARGRRSTGRHARGRQAAAGGDTAAQPRPPEPEPEPSPEDRIGPYDSGQSPPAGSRFDLGSLQIPTAAGVQVKVAANQQGAVQRVMLVHGDSALHLVVLAAPRTEPIWDEVREEIRQSLAERKVTVTEIDGDYGIELRAKVPAKQGTTDVRFVGVNGPRWLLRADFHGPVARDPARSPQLVECLRGLVVDRGTDPRPAKEPLPLQLSEQMAAQIQQQAAAAAARRPSPRPGDRGTGPSVDRM